MNTLRTAIVAMSLLTTQSLADDPAGRWTGSPNAAWYKNAQMTDAAKKRLGYQWTSCCEHSDVFRTAFWVNKDNGDDEWWYQLPNGSWKLIPNDIIHWGEFAPDGRPTLFIYQGVETCFYVGEDGG